MAVVLRGALLLGVAGVLALAGGLDPDSGFPTWLAMRRDLGDARARIEGIRADIAALEREAQALESEPFAIERAIREELSYAKPGETLLRKPRGDGSNPRFP